MATEKQIWNQIQSTKNIKKITSSMKMVSAAKLKGDENRLARATAFNSWTHAVSSGPMPIENATYDGFPDKVLLVPFTSDKGLCGGVNSYVTRATRAMMKTLEAQGKTMDVVVIGDKGRSQMKRLAPENIKRSATDVVSPGTFALASGLASELIAQGAAEDYDAVVLIYNKYINAATYTQMYKVITPLKAETEGGDELLETYTFEPDEKSEAFIDMYEYLLASECFHSFMDSATSEQSSRMTAMENASKNANDMIDSLTLKYNRVRQARITTELIEIISGASALED